MPTISRNLPCHLSCHIVSVADSERALARSFASSSPPGPSWPGGCAPGALARRAQVPAFSVAFPALPRRRGASVRAACAIRPPPPVAFPALPWRRRASVRAPGALARRAQAPAFSVAFPGAPALPWRRRASVRAPRARRGPSGPRRSPRSPRSNRPAPGPRRPPRDPAPPRPAYRPRDRRPCIREAVSSRSRSRGPWRAPGPRGSAVG